MSASIVRPASWAACARIAAAATSLLASAILGRLLGPDGFGTVALVTSVATAAAFVGSAGLNRLLLRDVSSVTRHRHVDEALEGATPSLAEHQRVAVELREARRLLLGSVPLAAVLSGAVIWAAAGTDGAAFSLAVAGAALTVGLSMLLVLSDLLRGMGEVRWANLASGRAGGALVLGSLVGLLLVVQPSTALSASVCLALAATGSAAVLLLAVHRRRGELPSVGPGPASPVSRRTLAALAAPFAGTQLMLFIGSQVDLWVAGGMFDPSDVGDYAAALRLMALVTLPLTAAQLALVAPIAALHARGERATLERRVRSAATTAGLPALVALVPCVVVPGLVLRVVYGEGFEGAATLLAVLAVGQAVNVATGLCGTVLTMAGRQRLVLLVTGGGAAVSVVCDVGAAAWAGPVGLAVASATTTAAMFVSLWWLSRRVLGIRTEPSAWQRHASTLDPVGVS